MLINVQIKIVVKISIEIIKNEAREERYKKYVSEEKAVEEKLANFRQIDTNRARKETKWSRSRVGHT